ncbi:MKI67 FHA domain-interacting nucleolar phosphoprotein-like [Leptinotarsa decemlineata]|uniref:MKI67 FHA domain-interacting nucleolar phosphoprotein-like n=1 Tax=Leptinotarsa decemlineata TaxID=7539 RepID=UPI003D30CAC5
MAKIKSAETLSLDTSKQKKVSKQTKKLKKLIEDGSVSIREERKIQKVTAEQKRGLLFISHLPHGFYENEMKKYFQQFGNVTNVKVCRSKRTGNSKGFGYVEFSNPDVAKIAAETMNNYLMFKKRITTEYIPFEKRPKCLFVGKSCTPTRYSSKVRRSKQYEANLKVDEKVQLRRSSSRLSKLNKKLKRLQDLGIKTTFKPTDLTKKKKT